MLRANRRVLRPAGRLGFTTMELAPDLEPSVRRRARDAGPSEVASRRPYAQLLRSARFRDVAVTDVTDEFVDTLASWRRETERRYDRLVEVRGAEAVDEALGRWTTLADGATRGWLVRRRYVATR